MTTAIEAAAEKPLFIPLKSEYYDAFCDGSKTEEFRKYGARWNERTCRVGRRVTISRGYGKQARRNGVIVSFRQMPMATKDYLACYGSRSQAACVGIELDGEAQPRNEA